MHSDNEQPSSSDPPDRKSSKPLMEKRRRARINSSLAELKTLLMDVIRREGACHSKMEKADILEMTVRHLRQITGSSTTDPTTGSKHKLGFVECTQEVSRFLNRIEGCDVELRTKLLDHLANVASGSQRHERVSSIPLLSVQPSNQNQPVVTNFLMQDPSRQLSVVSESVPYKLDLNPSIQTSSLQSNLMSGLQVIPTQLRSGEIAFVLPTQIAEIQKSSGVVIPVLNPVNRTLTLSNDGMGSGQTRDVSKPYRRIRVKSETVSSPPKSPPAPPSESLPLTSTTNVTGESHKPLAESVKSRTESLCASIPLDPYSRIPNVSGNPQILTSSDIKDNEPIQIQGNVLAEGHEKQYTLPKGHGGGQVVKKDDINIIPTFSDISQTDPQEKLIISSVSYPGSHSEHTSTKAVGLLDSQTYTNIVKSSSYVGPNALFSTGIIIPQPDKGLDLRLSEQVSKRIPNIKYDSKESHLFSFSCQHDAFGGDSDKTLKDTIWTLPSTGSSLKAGIKSHTQHDNSKLDENDNNVHHERQSDRDENDNSVNENANENQETEMWRPW